MNQSLSVKEISANYGELALVELPAIQQFAALGWETANLYHESFGVDGTEGRMSAADVILTKRLQSVQSASRLE